jgi:hypothetical protein
MQTDPMIAEKTNFAPFYLGQLHPIVWGLTSLRESESVCSPSRLKRAVSFLFDAPPHSSNQE